MKAFLDQKEVKNRYLNRVKSHQVADEIIKGKYWTGTKGCAVGCTIHSSDHKTYETELGIPEWLARTEDALFEGMSIEKSKTWPFKFLNAIKVGVDLEKVRVPFQILVLKRCLSSLNSMNFKDKDFPNVIKCIEGSRKVLNDVIELWKTGKILDESARSARSAAESARSAAESARSAAESAAWSAAESAAWSAAESARSAAESARSAAESAAWSAAESARSAAESARSAAESARSARSAAESARSAAFDEMAAELLVLLRACK